jgi:hypothetical protein
MSTVIITDQQLDLLVHKIANEVLVHLRPDFSAKYIPQSEVMRTLGRTRMYRALGKGELVRIKKGSKNAKCFIERLSYINYLSNRKP